MVGKQRRTGASHRPGSAAVPAPALGTGAVGSILRLHGIAGNRAVRGLLRQAGPLLGGVDADTRKRLRSPTTTSIPDADEEEFARKAPAALKDVDIQYGAKVPKGKDLRTGLQVIVGDMLDPGGHKGDLAPFHDDSTVTLELDLKPYGGENGLWQFTYLTTGKPAKRQLLIDYLGPAPNYDPPDNAATRFTDLGMKMSSGTAGPMGGSDKDAVYSAVSLLSDAIVAKLPKGLSFVRDKDAPTTLPPNTSAFYTHSDHTIRLLDRWLASSQVRYARATQKVATVLHELGHAIDDQNPKDHDAFVAALKKDGGTPISDYGAKTTAESYAECFMVFVADPALLEALRPKVSAYFTALFAPASATGASGAAGTGAGKSTTKAAPPVGAGSAAAPKH